MTNWLEENVTNLADSKRLADSSIDLGEADLTWETIIENDAKYDYKTGTTTQSTSNIKEYKAYRLDKLLAALPAPVEIYQKYKGSEEDLYFADLYATQSETARLLAGSGQPAIAACVDLLILLKESGDA